MIHKLALACLLSLLLLLAFIGGLGYAALTLTQRLLAALSRPQDGAKHA